MAPDELDQIVRRIRAQRNDDASVEVKACASALGSAVWDTVSAFANTTGGLLILGLDRAGASPRLMGSMPVESVTSSSRASGMVEELVCWRALPRTPLLEERWMERQSSSSTSRRTT